MENARIFLEREGSVKGDTCALGTDYFSVLRPLAKNDLSQAFSALFSFNPLAGVTGRLCPEPFIETQVFNKKGDRISMRAIEHFLADHARVKEPPFPAGSRQKIAVIGSGPAGLTAAWALRQNGFRVTVFEMSHVMGGSLSYAYPEFRLPSRAVVSSIMFLQECGVEFCPNVLAGRDIMPAELFDRGFAAVILACGAGLARMLGIPGEEAAGVRTVEDLLKARHWMKAGVEPYTTPFDIGRKVVVAGSGEKAFDSARVLVRLARQVTVVVSGSESHAGVSEAMIREATEEGVQLSTFSRPRKVLKDAGGQVKGLVCDRLDYRIDTRGRLNVVADSGGEFTLEADTLITCAGNEPDTLFLRKIPGISVGADGSLAMKPGTWETTVSGVFACGHLVSPAAGLLEVMVSSKRLVAHIERFLQP